MVQESCLAIDRPARVYGSVTSKFPPPLFRSVMPAQRMSTRPSLSMSASCRSTGGSKRALGSDRMTSFAVNWPVPSFSSTVTCGASRSAAARSRSPSLFRSAAATATGYGPPSKVPASDQQRRSLFLRILTVSSAAQATATSIQPSLSKSPTARAFGLAGDRHRLAASRSRRRCCAARRRSPRSGWRRPGRACRRC